MYMHYGRNINHNYAYYLHYTKLENMNVIEDLGVNFDPDLSFVLHCRGKNKQSLYAMLGIMRINFMYAFLSEEALYYYTRLMSDHN